MQLMMAVERIAIRLNARAPLGSSKAPAHSSVLASSATRCGLHPHVAWSQCKIRRLRKKPMLRTGLQRQRAAAMDAHGDNRAQDCSTGTGARAAAGVPDRLSTPCRRWAYRCCAAAACAHLCRRTAAQCCLWCCISAPTAGGSLVLPLLLASAPAESGGACGAGCRSRATASSVCTGSGGNLGAGMGCKEVAQQGLLAHSADRKHIQHEFVLLQAPNPPLAGDLPGQGRCAPIVGKACTAMAALLHPACLDALVGH